MLTPAAGKSFDPTRIPKAVKDAGFTAGEIEVVAVGRLKREKDTVVLEMTGPLGKVVLAGGAKGEELARREDLLGQRLRVTGTLHPSHTDQPPGLTVERWVAVNPGG